MLGGLLRACGRLFGRFAELAAAGLALFAVYEGVVAERIPPTLIGGIALCPDPERPDLLRSEALFRFLEDHADSVVYLDLYVTISRPNEDFSCPVEGYRYGQVTDTGLVAEGQRRIYEDGSGGPQPSLVIETSRFQTPQTARLTGQSGEEAIFGVTGLVYVEAAEVDMGFQDFNLSAAPYADPMLRKRACAEAWSRADGSLARLSAYISVCMAG